MPLRPDEPDATALATHAVRIDGELRHKILPYWFDTAQDFDYGGYLLADDGIRRTIPDDKQLVSQARLLWVFSHAQWLGYSDARRCYLAAAEQGWQFLSRHFLDPVHGGYVWQTDRAGKFSNDHKNLYGQAFVILALVEYYRAAGDPGALNEALHLARLVEAHCRDREQGGWREHFHRDWRARRLSEPAWEVDRPGWKGGNAHLHLMEALAELYDVSRDPVVREALSESLRCNVEYLYPADVSQACPYRDEAWRRVDEPGVAVLSYGHHVEFAWLMLRAEEVLGLPPSLAHFDAIMQHALQVGFDHQRGGLYRLGSGTQPAHDTDKVWWAQAELLAALTVGRQHRRQAEEDAALRKLLYFIETHQADPADGIWLDTVTADGRPKRRDKAHAWKAGYHEVRALVKFARTL